MSSHIAKKAVKIILLYPLCLIIFIACIYVKGFFVVMLYVGSLSGILKNKSQLVLNRLIDIIVKIMKL